MITGQVLESDASLNDFTTISTLKFTPGEQITLVFRLIDEDKELRFVPTTSLITTLTFNKDDGTTFTKTTTFVDVLDRSLLSVTLQEAETLTMLGGNIAMDLDIAGDASEIRKGFIFNGLSKVIVDC